MKAIRKQIFSKHLYLYIACSPLNIVMLHACIFIYVSLLDGSSEGCDIVTTAPQSFTEARTTATTPSTDPPTEAETNDLFVIIGACVGAGLLVVIVIVVVIILICCSRKGSDDSKADDVMVLNQMQRPPNDYQTSTTCMHTILYNTCL